MSRVMLLLSLLCFCAPALAEEHQDSSRKLIGQFKPSFYWAAMEKDDKSEREVDLLDRDGKVIATISKSFHKELTMEGTGKLLDRRVINFDLRVKKPDGTTEIRWLVCPEDAPYGYGKDYRKLVPFRSIAVDTREIALDSVLYIPEAKGTKLPDGTVHDGIFKAVDIGGMIQGKRIDLFTSFGDQKAVFERNGLKHMKPVSVYLVKKSVAFEEDPRF